MNILRYFVIFISFFSAEAIADCNYSAFAEDYFSNSKTKDRLYSIISGERCSNAKHTLEIKTLSGRLIYKYEDKMRCNDSYGNVRKEDVLRCLNWNLRKSIFPDTSSLPSWKLVHANPLAYLISFKVSKDKYAYYRSRKWKVFGHGVGYEGSQTLVFDRDVGKVVVVSITDP